MTYTLQHETPVGPVTITATGEAVTQIRFGTAVPEGSAAVPETAATPLLLKAAAFCRDFLHAVSFHIGNTAALRIIYPARQLYSFIIVICSLRYRVHVLVPFAISFPLPVILRSSRVDFFPVLLLPAVWAFL